MDNYANTFNRGLYGAKSDALLNTNNANPIAIILEDPLEVQLANLNLNETPMETKMELDQESTDVSRTLIEFLNTVDEHAFVDIEKKLINPNQDVLWSSDVQQSPIDDDFASAFNNLFLEANPISTPQILDDFDMNRSGETIIVKEIEPSMVEVNLEVSTLEKSVAAYFANFKPETEEYVFLDLPCCSTATTSTIQPILIPSTSYANTEGSKRGRKPKNWSNPEFISTFMASTSNKCKAKNNIASGQYRKNKTDARRKLEEKIAILEAKNAILRKRAEKNDKWIEEMQLICLSVNYPYKMP